MTGRRFTRSFTQQLPIPEVGIEAAVEVMRNGRLHRYNTAPGEESETAAFECEYARWQGACFCLAVASGGQAMQIALRAAGAGEGDKVLTNGFTLAPVPGAISAVGGVPILVEITEDLVIDFDDLAAKARASGARHLLLSNMRGHLCDMDRLTQISRRLGITLIEDCAHTMGACWNGRKPGSFGLAGCFSTQTYKHLNSGEGGILTSDDAGFMARATVLSGSYMLFDRHGAGPDAAVYDEIRYHTPNVSARMDNLRAAVLRPQLDAINSSISAWNACYDLVASHLDRDPIIRVPNRSTAEAYVGSSIQFRIPEITAGSARAFVSDLAAQGIQVAWFGASEPSGFTSAHQSWRYMAKQDLPNTDRILAGLFDMRLPLTFSPDDCEFIARTICEAASSLHKEAVS